MARLKQLRYTVGKLAKHFGLSRSTLLYYDSIGLLCPSGRTTTGYRIYSERDVRHLEQIHTYRAAGIPLKDIGRILEHAGSRKSVAILEQRLSDLNADIGRLRSQQHLIVQILKRDDLRRKLGVMDAAGWLSLMRAAGLGEEGMHRWHREFETLSPQSHHDFLQSLGLSEKEIREIRRLSLRNIQSPLQ